MLATAVAPIRAKRPLINLGMEIRALSSADTEAFRAIRRESLENAPRAFAESLAEHDSLSPQQFAKRLASSFSNDNFIIGAFRGNEAFRSGNDPDPTPLLAGVAGFVRNPRPKLRHKGLIWGVYVRPAFRGTGVAREILAEVIRRTKTLDGLEQINLNVATGTAARRLYESLGFEVYGHERNSLRVDREFVDEDLMVLFLKKGD
jgi:RimJ/RimL family protein N-acetyltransferase